MANQCEHIPLPAGFEIGQRIRTNDIYARVHRRAPYQEGTVTGGSRSCDGGLRVQWDSFKRWAIVSLKLIEKC
jgi:hypothetical protein